MQEKERERDALAEVQDRAQVVRAVADVDDLVERVPPTVALHPRLELGTCRNKSVLELVSAAHRAQRRARGSGRRRTLAHVGRAPDLAAVLRAVRVDAALELEETVVAELGRVRDDLVEQVGVVLVLRRRGEGERPFEKVSEQVSR